MYETRPPWLWPEDPTPQSEMPTGQMVRNPKTMGAAALQNELASLRSPYGRYGGQVAPGLAGLFSLTPGLGLVMGGLASVGMRDRRNALFGENQARQIANLYPGGGGGGITSAPVSAGLMGQSSGGQGGGYQGVDSAPAGLSGDWDDETGFGGA